MILTGKLYSHANKGLGGYTLTVWKISIMNGVCIVWHTSKSQRWCHTDRYVYWNAFSGPSDTTSTRDKSDPQIKNLFWGFCHIWGLPCQNDALWRIGGDILGEVRNTTTSLSNSKWCRHGRDIGLWCPHFRAKSYGRISFHSFAQKSKHYCLMCLQHFQVM